MAYIPDQTNDYLRIVYIEPVVGFIGLRVAGFNSAFVTPTIEQRILCARKA
jgi:hypothetical protein